MSEKPSRCHCGPLDSAIARARRQIELVQEYRTRLIVDVVTGKLDVREAAGKVDVREAAAQLPQDRLSVVGLPSGKFAIELVSEAVPKALASFVQNDIGCQ